MSLRAVGWLNSALGVDITGRQNQGQEAPDAPRTGMYASLNGFMQRLSEGVFGGNGGDGSDEPFGRIVGVDETGEQLQVDADGLPVGRNWYAFNDATQRWEPTADAPASVKADFETKLREAEAAAAAANCPAELPPPPPASMFAISAPAGPRGPQPLYADTGLFATSDPVPAPLAPAPLAPTAAASVPMFPEPPVHGGAPHAPFAPAAFVPGAASPMMPAAPASAAFMPGPPAAPVTAPVFPAPPMQGGFGTLPPLPPLQ